MTPHNTSQEELLKELQTSAAGLSSQEAQQRLERYGENKLAEKRKKTNLQRFLDQFKDVMILILLLAAAVSFVVACFGHDPMEFFEPVLILLIVVLNALLGMMQESKAEKAMDALKNMSAPHARVLRDGKEQVIDAAQLVPGDIIRLEAGDFIPADARLLKSVSLKSEESALTGESVPSEKDAAAQVEEKAPLGDRSNTARPRPWSPAPAWIRRWAKSPACWKGKKRGRRLCSRNWPSWENTWALWPWGPAPSSLWWGCSTAFLCWKSL